MENLKNNLLNKLNKLDKNDCEYEYLENVNKNWDKFINVVGGDKEEYSNYLKNEYNNYNNDYYDIFLDKSKNKISKYWEYVNKNIKEFINKDKISILELYKGINILYWGYVDIIDNGGDDIGCNSEGISMIWDEISEMIGFKWDEWNEDLRIIINDIIN